MSTEHGGQQDALEDSENQDARQGDDGDVEVEAADPPEVPDLLDIDEPLDGHQYDGPQDGLREEGEGAGEEQEHDHEGQGGHGEGQGRAGAGLVVHRRLGEPPRDHEAVPEARGQVGGAQAQQFLPGVEGACASGRRCAPRRRSPRT